MIQKSMVTIFVFLQLASLSYSSDRLLRILTERKNHVEPIKAQRKHCAELIQMRIAIAKELEAFKVKTSPVVGYGALEQKHEEVCCKLRSDKWIDLTFWYLAHPEHETLFLKSRNSGDDLAKLYGVLQPAEQLMQGILDGLQSFNRSFELVFLHEKMIESSNNDL